MTYRASAIAEPELLVLFEDRLEELEAEAQAILNKHGRLNEKALAEKLGLSQRGTMFLISKLKRKGG
ncbi:MAG: winged helix-turn-helix transcriptional regulator [Desulfobacterales bacterium]